jgi:septum formation protein
LPLILASASAIRRSMLHAAGVEHQVMPAQLDEKALRSSLTDPSAIAGELAAAKALAVSAERPDDWVIGSDSVVEVGGRIFAKPGSRAEAAEHLRGFSGKPMRLTSAVALARRGIEDWRHAEAATLTVRALSDRFIETYLEAEWPEVGYTVGVFRLEGRGVQLFERIEGDYFVILGMPLIPLLGALRERAIIAA